VRTIRETPLTSNGGAIEPPRVTLSAAPGLFLAIDREVFDVRTGEVVGETHDYATSFPNAPTALSRDGRYFVSMQREAGASQSSQVVVSDTTTGEIVQQWETVIPGHDSEFTFLAFTENNRVFAIGSFPFQKSMLYTWDVNSGKVVEQIEGKMVSSSERPAINRNGSLVVVKGNEGHLLFDVKRRSVLANLENNDALGEPLLTEFSPDSQKIFKESPRKWTVWDLSGNVISQSGGSNVHALAWLPDASGMHCGSTAMHWKYGTLWRGAPKIAQYLGVLGDEYVVYQVREHKSTRIDVVRWPLKQVQDSIAAMERGDGLVNYGDEISATLEMGEVRFANREQVQAELLTAIRTTLTKTGFKLVANAPLKLVARYAEASSGPILLAGRDPVYKSHMAILQELTDPLNANRAAAAQSYEQQGIVRRDGPYLEIRIGQHVLSQGQASSTGPEGTHCSLYLTMKFEGEDEILWTGKYGRSGGFRDGESITPESLRNGAFSGLVSELSFDGLPYFVPRDENLSALPVLEGALE